MKKKIHPKDQTKELAEAFYEFMQRNPERKREYDENVGEFFRAFCEKAGISEDKVKTTIKESLVIPAAIDASSILWDSWFKIIRELSKHPLFYTPEEKGAMWREAILKDAESILNSIIFPHPSQSLLIVANLERTKEAIMAEIEEIVTKYREVYQESTNRAWVLDNNGKVVDIVKDKKEERLKWLSSVDELLEVWDLWCQAGQKPWQRTMKAISKKVGRPESTVKSQWRMAYEKIHGKPYDPEKKYTDEQKRRKADMLCSNCPHGAVCYKKSGEWVPCADYRRLIGRERSSKLVEYKDDIQY